MNAPAAFTVITALSTLLPAQNSKVSGAIGALFLLGHLLTNAARASYFTRHRDAQIWARFFRFVSALFKVYLVYYCIQTHPQICRVMENKDGIVTDRVVKKLAINTPSSELVDAFLYEIAKGYSVNWTPPGFEETDNGETKVRIGGCDVDSYTFD
jgi:hypothetical protein